MLCVCVDTVCMGVCVCMRVWRGMRYVYVCMCTHVFMFPGVYVMVYAAHAWYDIACVRVCVSRDGDSEVYS